VTHPQTVDYLAELDLIEESRRQREKFLETIWKPQSRSNHAIRNGSNVVCLDSFRRDNPR
jgi:hypothetical protein